jgi:hypothetical protein
MFFYDGCDLRWRMLDLETETHKNEIRKKMGHERQE